MNHELAKELKDAGFPQYERQSRCPCHEPWGMCGVHEREDYIPTLSELIAACGDRFGGFCLWENRFYAFEGIYQSEHGFSDFQLTSRFYKESGPGKTPEEAVAELWLALNKNHES